MIDIVEHFVHLLHPQHDAEKMQLIAAVKARDAAIRADQARRDAGIAYRFANTSYSSPAIGTARVIAAEIERRAGIGKEKGDE